MVKKKKYFDALYNRFLDYIFRQKSLNRILWILVVFAISEMTALGLGDQLANLITELKIQYPKGIVYWALRIIETLYVDGNIYILLLTIFLIILFAYLKNSEIKKSKLAKDLLEVIIEPRIAVFTTDHKTYSVVLTIANKSKRPVSISHIAIRKPDGKSIYYSDHRNGQNHWRIDEYDSISVSIGKGHPLHLWKTRQEIDDYKFFVEDISGKQFFTK